MIKITYRVLKDVYISGKEISVNKLMKMSGLKNGQVYQALKLLKRRNLITKRYIAIGSSHKVPPHRSLLVKIPEHRKPSVIFLLKREGLINAK